MTKFPAVKIVVVDDSPSCLQAIENIILNSELFDKNHLKCFIDAFDALEFIKDNKAEILVTDYRMPGLNGNDLIEAAKEFYPGMKTILFSGSEIKCFPKIKSAIQNYVDVVLEKFPEKEILVEALSKLCG